jgi:hypothetical protein
MSVHWVFWMHRLAAYRICTGLECIVVIPAMFIQKSASVVSGVMYGRIIVSAYISAKTGGIQTMHKVNAAEMMP